MSTNQHRDASKERFWRRVLRLYRRSGLSARAFCEELWVPKSPSALMALHLRLIRVQNDPT